MKVKCYSLSKYGFTEGAIYEVEEDGCIINDLGITYQYDFDKNCVELVCPEEYIMFSLFKEGESEV